MRRLYHEQQIMSVYYSILNRQTLLLRKPPDLIDQVRAPSICSRASAKRWSGGMPRQRPGPPGSGFSARICPPGWIRWLRFAFHSMSVEPQWKVQPPPHREQLSRERYTGVLVTRGLDRGRGTLYTCGCTSVRCLRKQGRSPPYQVVVAS